MTSQGDRTLVEVAGLDRSTAAEGLEDEVRRLADALGAPPGTMTGTMTGTTAGTTAATDNSTTRSGPDDDR